MRKHALVLSIAMVLALTGLMTSSALAHAGFFRIWAWYSYQWTGVTNHWQGDPDVWNPPYDYMVPMEAEVYQDVQLTFFWKGLHTPTGWQDSPRAYGFKGDSYIFASEWGQVYYTNAFFCRSVLSNDATYFSAANPTSAGYWELITGGGAGSNCYFAYAVEHFQGVESSDH